MGRLGKEGRPEDGRERERGTGEAFQSCLLIRFARKVRLKKVGKATVGDNNEPEGWVAVNIV